jgi:hypothetical protein
VSTCVNAVGQRALAAISGAKDLLRRAEEERDEADAAFLRQAAGELQRAGDALIDMVGVRTGEKPRRKTSPKTTRSISDA